MKPASCFRDLASFSNRQKRLQQNRRYAVEIHNDGFRTRPLAVLLAKPTNAVLCSPPPIQFQDVFPNRVHRFAEKGPLWITRPMFLALELRANVDH